MLLPTLPMNRLSLPFQTARRLVCAALIASMTLLPLGARSQVNLPALGDSVSDDFGIGAERHLGDQIMREIKRDPDYIEDPILDEYVDTIWQLLLKASREKGNISQEQFERFGWDAFLVRDRSVNAFALPGGFIGVHLGLIAITGTRDELASVMAHELSHITQRHIARGMVNSQRQTMLGLAAMLLGLIAAGRSNSPDAMSAVVAGSQAATVQGQLNFSRDMEREADRVGFQVMTAAGFAPAGMAAMFQKMESAFRLNDSNSFPYLRTHPLTTERIGEARSRLGTAAGTTGTLPSSLLEHAVMQARSRVLMDPRADSLLRLEGLDTAPAQLPSERLASLCASAMAASQLRDWERSASAMQSALAVVRTSPQTDARAQRAITLLQAQLLLDHGEPAQAAEVLKPYAADESRPLVMLRGQIANSPVIQDEPALRRSAEALQTRVAVAPLDSSAWGLLGQLQNRLGQPLRALRAEAEARYGMGDLSGAVDRLRAGQRAARAGGTQDLVEASVIEARLRDVEAQRKAWAIEMKLESK